MARKESIEWKKIAGSAREIPGLESGIGEVEVDARDICIAGWGGQWHAFAGLCPHAGTPLSEGELDARGNIICPRHGYRFNIRTGLNITGEGFHLKCWPVEEREDGLYVGFRKDPE